MLFVICYGRIHADDELDVPADLVAHQQSPVPIDQPAVYPQFTAVTPLVYSPT